MERKTSKDREEKKAKFITFTELYSLKQAKLNELIKEFGAVYISNKNLPPLKITVVELG